MIHRWERSSLQLLILIFGCVLMGGGVLIALSLQDFAPLIAMGIPSGFLLLCYFIGKNSWSKREQSDIQLQNAINHFKQFYEIHGYTIYQEELARLISQYAMAESEDEQIKVLFSKIPDTIPTIDNFKQLNKKFINRLLNAHTSSPVYPKIAAFFDEMFAEITDFDVRLMYEQQKSTFVDGSGTNEDLFRFNYELSACLLILMTCDELSEKEENEENGIHYATIQSNVMEYAREHGYAMGE